MASGTGTVHHLVEMQWTTPCLDRSELTPPVSSSAPRLESLSAELPSRGVVLRPGLCPMILVVLAFLTVIL